MRNTPIERKLIDETIEAFQIADFGKATIREVKAIAAKAEVESGIEFIKMEMGVPGLPPSAVGVKAEIEALQRGIASLYPDINGLSALKEEASRFIKAFINVDLKPEGCVPVTGSMQGTFASFLTCSQCDEKRKIRYCLSTRDFLCKNNSWWSWDKSLKPLMYMTSVVTN